ncbi:MAG: hypothetical protein K1X31_14335 [Gemmatimonadaceae bacterium]|nr:hypothetical protein [Gemmatimonadaceae bacterium]
MTLPRLRHRLGGVLLAALAGAGALPAQAPVVPSAAAPASAPSSAPVAELRARLRPLAALTAPATPASFGHDARVIG